MISKLNLISEIMITDSTPEMAFQPVPKWIEFMIWAGWKMRTNISKSRQIMVMLLPERYCCSAFCSLGAVMAGSTFPCDSISWEEFEKFNEGKSIFLLVEHRGKIKPVEGVVGEFTNDINTEGRRVKIQSRNKNLNGASVLVLKSNIEKYQISITPHASQIKLGKLTKLSRFFNKTINGYQESWIVGNNIESAVVTNKVAWIRQIEGVNVISNNAPKGAANHSFELSKLLMIADCNETPSSHTRIISSVSSEDIEGVPLVILDGIEALSKWESYMQSNVIVLLSRSEFTEEAENIISMLSTYRDDDLLQNMEIDPTEIMPSDSEMALFALQGL